jgi:predicted RNA binding protein YcfA (HicA-like mRNA interferase family)
MPKLPRISAIKTIKTLEKMGFIKSRQTGSHVVLKKQILNGEIVCIVPLHKQLKIGTLSVVLKQAQVSPTEFINHL